MNASHHLLALFDQLADKGIVRRLGAAFTRFIASLGHDHPALLFAALALSEQEGHGHSCIALDALATDPAGLLGWDAASWQSLREAMPDMPDSAEAWASKLAGCPQVGNGDTHVSHDEDRAHTPLVLAGSRLYLRRYWRYETSVAQVIRRRVIQPRTVDTSEARRWLDLLFAGSQADPDWQKIACAIALRGPLTLITGGPGTGKTYTVARLLALLLAQSKQPEHLRIALAAPTGKAAARLKQSIDSALGDLDRKLAGALPLAALSTHLGAARTLHSLLGARPDTRALRHHAGNPLDVDVLIVDEASMIHLEMMAALLDALPDHAQLIMLGDKDQLASVEAGAVLGDLCRDSHLARYDAATCNYIAATCGTTLTVAQDISHALAQQTVMLRHSHRFGGPIGKLALAVNAGEIDQAQAYLRQGDAALHWLDTPNTANLIALALDGRDGEASGYRAYLSLLADQPTVAEFDMWVIKIVRAFEQMRLLCAVRDGDWGLSHLNTTIETALCSQRLISKRSEWYVGRPVMVTRNDYALGVFNGDVGLTLPDVRRPSVLRVYFLDGDTVRSVLASRLRDVETAFAMTVHKSQGSEFQHTILVLPPEAPAVLARELIYTGITRAKTYFTLVAPNPHVFAEAITRQTVRASGLQQWLQPSDNNGI